MQETSLGLKKPELNEFYDLLLNNANLDLLDQLIAARIEKIMIANNLLTTEEGLVLDARQGKALNDKYNELNNNLDDISTRYSSLYKVRTKSIASGQDISKWALTPGIGVYIALINWGTGTCIYLLNTIENLVVTKIGGDDCNVTFGITTIDGITYLTTDITETYTFMTLIEIGLWN